MQGECHDRMKLTPQTTYGMTKAICELLVNDHSRKGHFDGRSARLPTVIIRPVNPMLQHPVGPVVCFASRFTANRVCSPFDEANHTQ